MATLDEFGDRMIRRSVRVEANLNRKIRRIAVAILTELVVQTPVDTGRARSNWLVGVGGPPDDGNIQPYFPGTDGSTDAQNASAAIQAGTAAVSDREPGQSVYISNNLPYIERLNEGSSSQAPAGFVQTAVTYGTRRGSRGTKILED